MENTILESVSNSELVKHVITCLNCDFQKTKEKYSSVVEFSFLNRAREHCKETKHTVYVQS